MPRGPGHPFPRNSIGGTHAAKARDGPEPGRPIPGRLQNNQLEKNHGLDRRR